MAFKIVLTVWFAAEALLALGVAANERSGQNASLLCLKAMLAAFFILGIWVWL